MTINSFKILPLVVFLIINNCLYAQTDTKTTKKYEQQPPTVNTLLQWQETFTYDVDYSFFRLGKVEVKIFRDTLQNTPGWMMQSIITSNPSIPFMSEEENHYNSFFVTTDSLPQEVTFWRDNVDEEEYRDLVYNFDRENGRVFVRQLGQPADTLALKKGGNSGQLIFLLARTFAGTDDSLEMPIYIEKDTGFLKVRGTPKTEMREYDAFDNPVKTFYSEGNTTIEGPFGFKGSFKSWYMADDLRVPLEAHVKVWLGNVKIRLTEYTKELRE